MHSAYLTCAGSFPQLGTPYAQALHAEVSLHLAQHRLGSAEGRMKGEPAAQHSAAGAWGVSSQALMFLMRRSRRPTTFEQVSDGGSERGGFPQQADTTFARGAQTTAALSTYRAGRCRFIKLISPALTGQVVAGAVDAGLGPGGGQRRALG